MPTPQVTSIPYVPQKTPMFDNTGTQAGQVNIGNLTIPWIYFFEQVHGGTGGSSAGGPYGRTLLLRNTTVANDVADHVTCNGPVPGVTHTVLLVTGVLRKAITADLTVRINNVSSGTTIVVGTFTIPSATAIDTPVQFSSFDNATLDDLSVFTWDVTASDGSKDSAGIASFTIVWQP